MEDMATTAQAAVVTDASRRFGADRETPLSVLKNVEMQITVELGRAKMTVGGLLSMASGDVIELDRPANAPVDILVNGTLVARGEVVVVDDEFGVRVTEIVGRDELEPATGE